MYGTTRPTRPCSSIYLDGPTARIFVNGDAAAGGGDEGAAAEEQDRLRAELDEAGGSVEVR